MIMFMKEAPMSGGIISPVHSFIAYKFQWESSLTPSSNPLGWKNDSMGLNFWGHLAFDCRTDFPDNSEVDADDNGGQVNSTAEVN